MTDFYHIGVIDKTNIPVVENNLKREELVKIVKAYHAKKDMIIRNKLIDCDSIKQIGIYRTKEKIIPDGRHVTVYMSKPEAHVRTDLPEGWQRAMSGAEITREIIDEVGEELSSKQSKKKSSSNELEGGLKDAKYWVDRLGIPLIVTIVGAVAAAIIIAAIVVSQNQIIFVNAPSNLYNEGYNPFLGLWQTSSAGTGSFSFPQMNITKDENNLVWVELFQGCTEEQCSLAKLRADKQSNKINIHYSSSDTDISVVLSIQGSQLRADINAKVVHSDGSGESAQLSGWTYDRVTVND